MMSVSCQGGDPKKKKIQKCNMKACTMAERNRNASLQRVHRHVVDRVVAYLTVPQQACARRASKALWEAVRAESIEDLLRATVHRDASNLNAQLVFVAMSGAVAPFPSYDVLVDWCGGLTLLYEELQQRFPRAAAIGVSAQLAAIRPFPFASGSTVATMCILFALPSTPPAHAVESVVLEVRNPSVLVRALSHDDAACPILCLDGVTPEHFPHLLDGVSLSSLPSIRCIAPSTFLQCKSLRSVCLANLPLLESIGESAFTECEHLTSVDLSRLPSLHSIGQYAFCKCLSLESVYLAKVPVLESIEHCAFFYCEHLTSVDLSQLPALRSIGPSAFFKCSLQSVTLANMRVLESIEGDAFAYCEHLTTVDLSQLPSLHYIGGSAFCNCSSLQSVTFAHMPVLKSIEMFAFARCEHLTSVDLSHLPSLYTIGECAFYKCPSLRHLNFTNLPVLDRERGDYWFRCRE